MYLFESAIAVSKNMGSHWESLDISDMIVRDIFITYRKVYITLTNNYIDGLIYIDLDSLRDTYSVSEITFNELLLSIGDNTLRTIKSIPVLKPKYVKFSDAFRAGYKIEPQNINTSFTANVLSSSKESLRLSRSYPATDMELFYKHCMVSINGYFHMTDCDGTNAYILNANKSLFKSKQNQIGILNFLDVGEIKQIPITSTMITQQAPEISLRKRTCVKLNMDLTDKTVLLVLNGYLIFPDAKNFWQTGEDVFTINFNSMPLLERYYESFPYIDFTSLNLPVSSDNASMINIEEFFSDSNLKNMLMLSQTFFVVIDTPVLFTNKIHIRPSKLPGMFTSYQEPTYPLFVSNGRIAEYWKTFEDGYWTVNVHDSYLHKSVFSSRTNEQLINVSNSDIPERTSYNSRGFMLEIGKDF